MLTFFHTPEAVELEENLRFPAMQFRSSDRGRKNGVIPFSHIYVTSASQLLQFVNYGKIGNSIRKLDETTTAFIKNHKRCPMDISFRGEGISEALDNSPLKDQQFIKLAIVNGMGRGYGDNIAGLGVLQHLGRLLRNRFASVQIELLQRNTKNQSLIHTRYDVVNKTVQLPVSVTQLFTYDAYIDLSDLTSNPEFDSLPLFDFFIQALSMQKEIVSQQDKRTKLRVSSEAKLSIRNEVFRRANQDQSNKLVMIHPSASTKLRTISPELLLTLMQDVLDRTEVIFVCAVPIEIEHARLINVSDLSNSINDLIDIVSSCDGVITVGTVVYHVSGNLDIPTLLIPTVQADVLSAVNFPSVKTLIPCGMRSKISNKHMSKDLKDIEQAQKIFSQIKSKDLIEFVEMLK